MDQMNWQYAARRVAAAAALVAGLVGCGGGGSDSAPAAAEPEAPKTLTLAAKADKSYGAAWGSSGASIEVFRDSSGAVTQSLYTNPKTGEKVRTFNSTDGLPERVVDEATGNTLTITRTSPERVDYRAFDASGKYLGGYAVLIRSDGLYAATVSGTPSFSGQLTGQLRGAAQTGSFALLPATDAGLGTATPLSAAALSFADGALAASAAADGRAGPLALAGIDRRAVIGGLVTGALLASGGWAPALIGGGMMAFGLQNYFLPVFDGVRNANSLEQMSENLNTFLDRFDRGASGATALSDSLAGTLAERVRGAAQRAFDAAKDTASSITVRASLPALNGRAPVSDTAVSGFGVDQSGTNYSLTGSVGANGALSATATADGGTGTILINGNVSGSDVTGTISGRLGDGTVSGSVGTLGQCAALQQSGGQGTFSYAFDTGAVSGTIQFYRNAYTIPDGFRVISNGQTLYDTGGLVSGIETRTLALVGSRVLFVNVNAPRSGTAWELSVGCPA